MSLPVLAAFLASGLAYLVRKHREPRNVFFSFHYADIWQAQQVRNSWVTHANVRTAGFFDKSVREDAKTHQTSAIRSLIDRGLEGTDVTAVLIGSQTATRRWVRYEIEQSAMRGNGLLGIYIHTLRGSHRRTGAQRSRRKGRDPFSCVEFADDGATLDEYVPTYDWSRDDGYMNMRKWVRAAPTLKEIVRQHHRLR